MANQENIHPSKMGSSGSGIPTAQTPSGSPGRTAGTAEGERETVEEDLRSKNLSDENNDQRKANTDRQK